MSASTFGSPPCAGGNKFRGQAVHLHSGAVNASMGDIDLDLSDASLDVRSVVLIGGFLVTASGQRAAAARP